MGYMGMYCNIPKAIFYLLQGDYRRFRSRAGSSSQAEHAAGALLKYCVVLLEGSGT